MRLEALMKLREESGEQENEDQIKYEGPESSVCLSEQQSSCHLDDINQELEMIDREEVNAKQ